MLRCALKTPAKPVCWDGYASVSTLNYVRRQLDMLVSSDWLGNIEKRKTLPHGNRLDWRQCLMTEDGNGV